MSSLVSLRSYQRRRKSAGARLEGIYSQQGVYSREGSYSVRGDVAPGTASEQQQQQQPAPAAVYYKEKRVKSARETRREQEASDVFPELQKARVDPEWGKTKYSDDFGPKVVSPVHIRPVSPTRMNNPHPSKVIITAPSS